MNANLVASPILLELHRALEKDPENASIHLDLSNVYLSLKDIDRAKQHLYQALRINPNYAEGYNNLGRLFYKQRLFKDAIPLFEKALRLYPTYFEAHYNLANSFVQLNNYDRALIHYQNAVSLRENHYDARHNLGMVLFEAERYSEAEIHLQMVWEATKYIASGLILGQIYLALGKVENAKKLYEWLIAKEHTLTEAHHNLGILFLWAHEYEKARKQFETVLRYDPSNETARHMALALKEENEDAAHQAPTQYVKDLFDQYADHYDHHVKEKLHYQAPFQLRNAIGKKFGEKLKAGRLLDLGCGTGLSGVYMRDLATDLVGIDISAKMIEKAQTLGAYDELHTIEILEYLKEAPSNPFNFIIASDVFVYCGDLAPIFAGVVKHLVWGGVFAFTTESLEMENLNVESTQTKILKNFKLQKTGRFAHSMDYILQLAKQHALQMEWEEKVVLRKNNEIDILGRLYILKRY